MSIKGIPFIGKIKEFTNNFKELYVTVQKIGPSRSGLDVIHKGYYILNPVPSVAYVVEAGSTDNLLKLTAHGFKAGDLIRLDVTSNPIDEFEIVIDSVVDANTVKLSGYLSASLTAGDTFFALRAVSERFNKDGSTLASITTPPVSYNRKIAGVTTQTSVLEDLDTPANSRAMPVVLHGVDAASINITSGDLNITSSHVNDSVAIGDGVRIVQTTASNELKTSDATTQTNTGTIATNTTNANTKLDTLHTDLGTVATNQTAQSTLLGAVTETAPATDTASSGLNGRLQRIAQRITSLIALLPASLGSKADASSLAVTIATEDKALLGALTETAPATDTASSGLNGRLQRVAQRITSLIALLPASLGQKAMAASFAVTIASDQSAVATTDAATTAINTATGAQADAVATTDTGTFSKIALLKRIAQNITTMSAKLPAALGATTSAASLSVAPATDAIFNVKPKALTGAYDENLALTTVATFVAPSNAIGGTIMADDSNAVNIRYKQGGAATTTSGLQLQPGRSERIGNGSNVSIIAQDGATSSKVFIIWDIQA